MSVPALSRDVSSRTGLHSSFQRLEPEVWSPLLAEFADGNFYQTWAYGAVSWGRNNLLHLVIRNGQQSRAIAQVRTIRLGRFWGVAYVRWGPCVQRRGEAWDAGAFREALATLAAEFVQRRRWVLRVIPNVFWEDPAAGEAAHVFQELNFHPVGVKAVYRTARVDLTPPLEVVRKRLDGKWRNQLNAAQRNVLQVVEGDATDLFHRFIQLYDAMMERKRFETTVDVRQFARMQEQLLPTEKMRIALATRGDELHAGVVATGVGETGIYLLGATGEAGLKSKASYLLQWRMIEFLKAQGCHFYDLGGINPEGNPGVYHFKSGMGGQEVRQLGRYELAASEARRRLLHWAESLQRLLRRWRKR